MPFPAVRRVCPSVCFPCSGAFCRAKITHARALVCREPYKKYIQKPILDDEVLSQCVGWKDVPETVNGRLAMCVPILTTLK